MITCTRIEYASFALPNEVTGFIDKAIDVHVCM